jgi:RHS repeat-associated protein
VTQQLFGDFLYQLDYEQLQYVPENPLYVDVLAIRAVVHPPDGSLHTYTFNYRGDLLDYRFRLNRDGSYRIVNYQWEYDEQGNMTKEAVPSGETLYSYDYQNNDPCARGTVLKVERRAALPDLVESRIIFRTDRYSEFQLPLEILDEDQNITRFKYDKAPPATGKLASIELPEVTLPNGKTQQSILQFEHNSRGQVTATISAENIRNEIHYFPDEEAFLAGFVRETIQDVGGLAYKLEYHYDPAGRIEQITKPAGIATQFSFNTVGQLDEVTLPPVAGSVARFRTRYTSEGDLLELERPRGSYDDSVITGDSIVDKYTLNALGQVQQIVVGENTARPRTTRYCRDHAGRPVNVIDPMGMQIRRSYDERGLLLRETIGAGTPEALTTSFTYERDGRLRRIEEADGQVTEVEEWDLWQRPFRTRFPNGSMQKLKWDHPDRVRDIYVEGDPGDGGPVRMLSHQGFEYDKRGRLTKEKDYVFYNQPDSAVELVTTYFYDADDRLRRIQLPRGGVLSYEYDGLNRLIRTEDVFGNIETTSYNADDSARKVTREEHEPGGVRTTVWLFEQDARGRPTKVTVPGGTEVMSIYDDRNLVVERQEPLNVIQRFRYGLLGELEETLLDPTGLAIKSQYGYDLLGRLDNYIDPTGEATRWQRDTLGRVTSIQLPDKSNWQQAYNNFGKLYKRTTPSGSQILYAYESLSGDLSTVEYIPGAGVLGVPKHEFKYDGLGRLVQALIPGQAVTRQYDSVGREILESAQGKNVQFVYDDLLGTFDLVYPDGRREQTATDLGGRPIKVSLLAPGTLGGSPGATLVKLVYAGSDRLHTITHGNGVMSSLAYDDALRLIRLDHTRNGQMLESCWYRYDERGRCRLMQLLAPPQLNRLHRFDARDRLTQASWEFPLPPLPDAMSQQEQDADIAAAEQASLAAQKEETFWLNDADSREKYQRKDAGNVTTTAYSYVPGHKMTQVGSEILSYHPDGPREKDGELVYEIDAMGRVVRIRDVATKAIKAEFGYDPFSRPTSGQFIGTAFRRWFVSARCIQEEDGNAVIVRQLTLHPCWPLPLMQHTSSNTVNLHPDGSLSTVCITEASGSVTERTRFEPFGHPRRLSADGITPLPSSSALIEPFFGGMPYLDGLGLYHSTLRLYDAGSGVFISSDPFLYADSPSPYLYTLHSPVNFIDPVGADKKTSNDANKILRTLDRSLVNKIETDPEFRIRYFLESALQPELLSAEPLTLHLWRESPGMKLRIARGERRGGIINTLQPYLRVGERPHAAYQPPEAPQVAINFLWENGPGFSAYYASYVWHFLKTGRTPGALEKNQFPYNLLPYAYNPHSVREGESGEELLGYAVSAVPYGKVPRFRAYNDAHRRFIEGVLAADPHHPLRPLLNPQTGRLRTGHWLLADVPVIESGHTISQQGVRAGAPELLTLQDIFFNRWASYYRGERQGLIFVNRSRLIGGLAVEERTLRLFARDPLFRNLTEDMVINAPIVYGHDPRKGMQLQYALPPDWTF